MLVQDRCIPQAVTRTSTHSLVHQPGSGMHFIPHGTTGENLVTWPADRAGGCEMNCYPDSFTSRDCEERNGVGGESGRQLVDCNT